MAKKHPMTHRQQLYIKPDDRPVWKQAKDYCAKHDVSLSSFVTTAVALHLRSEAP